ncbi:hypothetical protein [Denitrificimonas caeni]|uniref:Uncharacterized protein n=1 Tax=Denitrificimonas caeni TaxID=521720 RepID=A0AAF0AK32_9GAMM|nr:hypothetical protein [Denitrificimonas caeni]WBE25031.1 hypothetical protein O6P33_11810 [Denitrificimonas caeni]
MYAFAYRANAAHEPCALVLALQVVSECFGVGVDGAAPALNPGRVHQRMNTDPEVRPVQ